MSYMLILIVCVLTTAGQWCQKRAADRWQQQPCSWSRKLVDPWLMVALACLGSGLLLWLLVLHSLPLNRAYPMLSLNFVLITLLARLVWNERMTGRHLLGVGCIVVGVVLVGVSA